MYLLFADREYSSPGKGVFMRILLLAFFYFFKEIIALNSQGF